MTACFLVNGDDVDAQQQVGAMWRLAWDDFDGECLSAEHRGQRDVIAVRLPDRSVWIIDYAADFGRDGASGWTRIGLAPRLTVTPSVNTGAYHGWLTDGVLTPDFDGRTYG